MSMRRRPALLLAALTLSLLSGCAALQRLAAGAFKRPTLTFKTASLRDVSLGGATVDLVYTVNNPNPFGLELASVDYAFFVEGKQLVAGSPPRGLDLRARGNSDLTFPAGVKFADLAPVLSTFLTRDRAAYKAQGTVGIQTPLGVLRFPLEHEGFFDVPKIPQVQFQPPRIANLTFSGATLELPVTVTNRNAFPLPVGGVSGGLLIAGARVGSLATGDLGLLQPGQSRQVTLPLTVNFARAAQAASALRQGSAVVGFDGQLQSGAQAVPLTFRQNLSFQR